ncbi:hypothetical protein DITRI_Ditri20bG0134800 [Diplodiscus trichospermus]
MDKLCDQYQLPFLIPLYISFTKIAHYFRTVWSLEIKHMAATFARGAHTINSIFSKPTIRKCCSKGSSCADKLREPMKMEAEEVKKKSIGGNQDGSCWIPHDRTGIYYPKGQEKVMEDVPAIAAKNTDINWFTYH